MTRAEIILRVMRWLLGMDLEGHGRGALNVAAWLCAQPFAAEIVAVHVINERIWGPRGIAEALRPSAEHALVGELQAAGLAPSLVAARVVTAPSVESGLARVACETSCDAMMIGRAAPREGRRLVRLGSTARHLLRELPLPVMVVPADMSSADIGDGPVVIGVELESCSVLAARLAATLAAGLHRALVAVHVDASYRLTSSCAARGTLVPPREPQRMPSDVSRWAALHGLDEPSHIQIGDGDVVEGLLDESSRRAAPFIVVGSRELGLMDRVFSSSVASALARDADRPVLVVPPSRRDAERAE